MNIFRKLLNYIYPNFNPAQVSNIFIDGDGVTYGLLYEDNGNGTSKVILLISPSYQSKTYEWDTGVSVANELKGQLFLSLIADSAEIDRVGITFPEEGRNEKGEKYVKGLSLNTYEVKHSVNASSVKRLSIVKLQKNKEDNSPANSDNRYSDPQAVTLDNGDVVVIAKNLKDKTLVSWYLKSDKSGKFKALAGSNGITERKLFKLDNLNSQFILKGKTLLCSQRNKRLIENQEVETTDIFALDMTKTVQELKTGKGTTEYLLGNRHGKIDNEESFFSSENKIRSLEYIIEQDKDKDVVAFLEKDQLSNVQRLHLVGLNNGVPVSEFSIYEFKDSIEQLYIKADGKGGLVVTAISEENIITFNKSNFEKFPSVTIIPANSIKLSDFVRIINGQLIPDIISTLPTITVTETVVTPEPTSTASVPDSSSQSSSIAPKKDEGAASSTVEPTTPSPTEADEGYSSSEELTSSSSTIVDPTTPEKQTEVPTTPSKSTQRVITIPSVSEILTATPTNSAFTRPVASQSTVAFQPTTQSPQFLVAGPGGSNNAGIAVGAFFGVASVVGVTWFGVSKCAQHHPSDNAEPIDAEASRAQIDNVSCGGDSIYELDYAEQKGPGLLSRVRSCFGRNKSSNVEQLGSLVRNTRRSSYSSDSNQSANNSIYGPPVGSNGMDKPEIILHGVSVDGRRSSSESLESSRSPSLSCSSTTSQSEVILHGVSVDSRSSSESSGSSRSPSPSRS